MTKLLMDGHVWRVELDETDTLKDMAAVSGYTMERLAAKIENIIAESIIEEDEGLLRLVQDLVRCKDCKHYNFETHGCKRSPSVERWLKDDYCSYGTRKESEEE